MSQDEALDPRQRDAAEYVIGTLDPAERRAFERAMTADPDLAALARGWEERLAPLAARVPPVEPGPGVWTAIEARLSGRSADNVVPFSAASVDRLRRSRTLWRTIAVAAGSIAAALALFIGAERLRPAAPGPTLLAVVNRSGDLPALVVRVDPRGGIVQVRALAAETPAGRSLQLWSVRGTQAPQSLGLIGEGATRIALPGSEAGGLDGATLAVSVEPPGGSPTGAPTGPVVYTGKLIPELP